MSNKAQNSPQTWSRQQWLGLLSKAPADTLAALAGPFVDGLDHAVLRAPESGAVMARGRAGATGAPFNMGEITITRASVELPGGLVGHGYVQGRDKAHALRVAQIDALLQTDTATAVTEAVLEPLAAAKAQERAARAAKAAATKVDFFTLARGED